ncbi:MAG: hypothetical protein ACTSQB_06685, partial [Candidatus Heimdallarchaeota archaeon]
LSIVMFSQFSLVNVKVNGISWPMEPSPKIDTQYVYYVVNDSFVDVVKKIPQINIRRFSQVGLTGRIALQLIHPPNISSRYEYRMIVFWDTRVRLEYNLSWPDLDWESAIPPKTNFTLCIAGGASWLGVTNGSYSAYYKSNGDLVFNESKSNSVKIVDDELQFQVKQDYIPDRYYAETVQVYTSFNATKNEVNTTSSEMYLDGLPGALIDILLDCGVELIPPNPIIPGFSFFSCFVIIVLAIVRKRKLTRT